jgi:hypothetical protein
VTGHAIAGGVDGSPTLIVVAASVPIRTFYGYYVSADWSEVIIKAVFLAALIKTKGNVVQIFKITRSQHGH